MYTEKDDKPPDISDELANTPITAIYEDIDCFTPRPRITIKYSGPNIRAIVKKAPEILRDGMRITGLKTYIDQYFCYAIDPNNIGFHIHWHGERDLDFRSKMFGWIRLKHGAVNPDGSGSVFIEFYSKVVTKWDRTTIFKRNPLYTLLLKIYNYVYYDEQRRKFVQQCHEYEEQMVKMMKDFLKLVETAKYPRV
jgi:hypothetical protein